MRLVEEKLESVGRGHHGNTSYAHTFAKGHGLPMKNQTEAGRWFCGCFYRNNEPVVHRVQWPFPPISQKTPWSTFLRPLGQCCWTYSVGRHQAKQAPSHHQQDSSLIQYPFHTESAGPVVRHGKIKTQQSRELGPGCTCLGYKMKRGCP